VSRHWRAQRYVALDFETTGLRPRKDGVISIGAVPIVAGRVDLSARYATVVDGPVVPRADSIRIHQLRPVDVRAGVGRDRAAADLVTALGDDPIVVWTAWVETEFAARLCGGSRRRWASRMIDVRHLVVRLDERSGLRRSPARQDDLATTVSRFGLPAERSHDALADAFVTAQLFVLVASRLDAIERMTPELLGVYGARS
jgi:DNA polymerase III subunit epsilon